jgi:rhodanese-related sulfurtransferase
LVVGISLVVTLSACSSSPDLLGVPVVFEGGTYQEISIGDLEPLLDDANYTIVNTHIPFEGDIPGTDLSVPFDQIGDHLDRFPDLDANIIVYCKGEGMSTIAAEALTVAGYERVFKLDGGMIAWEDAGLTLDRSTNP